MTSAEEALKSCLFRYDEFRKSPPAGCEALGGHVRPAGYSESGGQIANFMKTFNKIDG
jgi:hypothetical protein